jgi:hypothetical protein
MSRSDVAGIAITIAATILFGWFIRYAVRAGRWRYRTGTIYRDRSPKLFWGVVVFAVLAEVGLVLISLMLINQVIFCGSSLMPKACMAQTYHRFFGQALAGG